MWDDDLYSVCVCVCVCNDMTTVNNVVSCVLSVMGMHFRWPSNAICFFFQAQT